MAAPKREKQTADQPTHPTWSGCWRFRRTAMNQLRRSCVPMTVAIATSVILSKIEVPIVLLAFLGFSGWAYWKGYRVRIVRPDSASHIEG